MTHPPTLILRHARENLKKCSLSGLEGRGGLCFYTYPRDLLPDIAGYLLLKVGAEPLTIADAERGLFLIDGTWRLAQLMEKQLPCVLETRSLPSRYRTAYPRRQTHCPDPEAGLSSVEALFLSAHILGRPSEHFLDFYYWKDRFLKLNEFA